MLMRLSVRHQPLERAPHTEVFEWGHWVAFDLFLDYFLGSREHLVEVVGVAVVLVVAPYVCECEADFVLLGAPQEHIDVGWSLWRNKLLQFIHI